MQEAVRATSVCVRAYMYTCTCVHTRTQECGGTGGNSGGMLVWLIQALSLSPNIYQRQTNPQNKNDWQEQQETTVWFQHIFFSWLHIH